VKIKGSHLQEKGHTSFGIGRDGTHLCDYGKFDPWCFGEGLAQEPLDVIDYKAGVFKVGFDVIVKGFAYRRLVRIIS
jgi:hypothetical protein